ncbi:Type 3 secretion system secretin [Paraburkholderia aspalathi]|jgi:pilus assembly protein CpaC|uniref:Type 3 secretion system secretin n=1 Tax=Paraburkholderia aspalathi TaxID=1324617 RepID=A0ABM8QRA1_9BURK|nr:type II and III secretion system protein family protein [Paraburkholderia aspalathi]MBK3817642.1 secretin [Paraburkholderia aspalathi]MBK3829461.1 secretin [Paraburkholderia aspalathi]MBK3859146.1 secretin [Paraburkholderia aspalathi]CAE6710971.1 Type 3 secretion system secretin [Paraburkholderia aspalathi]
MNARPNHRAKAASAPHVTQPRTRLRIAQASACGLIGTCLWALPAAQAAGQNVPALPDTPLTVAASGPVHLTIGMSGSGAPASGSSQAGKGPNCTGPVADHTSVQIPVGKSTMVDVREPVRTRTVGNPSIVQAMLVSPTTLYLLGSDVGTTNMIVQGKSGSCTIIDVNVGADPAGLQQTLAVLMPEETGVHVKAAADTLVLTGVVSDSVKAERIVELAHAFVARPTTAVPGAAPAAGPLPIGGVRVSMAPPLPSLGSGNSERVINMMHIAAPQQVMLEVKVAEVSKTLIDQLGMSANINGGIGSWSFGLLADFLSGGLSAITASKANNSPLKLAFDAQKTDQLVKILAEPNLMAISGQEASFLAGGKVYIPVPQSNGTGGTTIVLQEEQYGVGLTFTPTVLEGGRINLKVAPEVSELSPTGVAITAGNSSNTTILPLITTRRASTTLQVYDGQSFAIGGLIKSNVTGAIKGLPGAGELPVLGALFRSTSYEQDKTELVFVVTPRLAKPLPQNYPLPTDGFGDAGEANVYLTGNMEGKKRVAPAAGAPSAAAATSPVLAAPTLPQQPAPAPDRNPVPVSGPTRVPAPDDNHGTPDSQPLTSTKPNDAPHSEPVPAAAVVSAALPADVDSHAAR